MKIAFLLGKFPNLSETFILNQIVGLMQEGHEVHIYASFPTKGTKIHGEVAKYNLLEHTYYFPNIPRNYLVRFFKGIQILLTHFPQNPRLLLRSLNIYKYGKKVFSLRLLYSTLPFLKTKPRYDVIHCHFGTNGLKGMELREIGAIQGKLCTTFHGLDISGNLQLYGEGLYEKLFEQGDLFLPISNFFKERLIKLGCEPKKITVHRMGIDLQKFTYRHRTPPTKEQIQIVTIGRFVEKKGLEYGIRAIAQLKSIYPNIEYKILGDGNLRESLEALIQDFGLEKNVKLLGWKQSDEIVEILNQSHILLTPSVTAQNGDQEGIPVVLMEAMAMGLPVISTEHSGIPELVEEGVSGFLVPERDSDALAQKIQAIIEHPELYLKFAAEGRLKVEKFYDNYLLNTKLIEIFQQIQFVDFNQFSMESSLKFKANELETQTFL